MQEEEKPAIVGKDKIFSADQPDSNNPLEVITHRPLDIFMKVKFVIF
jgi:hypothetical protein